MWFWARYNNWIRHTGFPLTKNINLFTLLFCRKLIFMSQLYSTSARVGSDHILGKIVYFDCSANLFHLLSWRLVLKDLLTWWLDFANHDCWLFSPELEPRLLYSAGQAQHVFSLTEYYWTVRFRFDFHGNDLWTLPSMNIGLIYVVLVDPN